MGVGGGNAGLCSELTAYFTLASSSAICSVVMLPCCLPVAFQSARACAPLVDALRLSLNRSALSATNAIRYVATASYSYVDGSWLHAVKLNTHA